MNSDDFDSLCFYCWQLNIKTLGDLAKWKAQHNATTNAETLEALAKAYNGTQGQNTNTAEQTATTKQKPKTK